MSSFAWLYGMTAAGGAWPGVQSIPSMINVPRPITCPPSRAGKLHSVMRHCPQPEVVVLSDVSVVRSWELESLREKAKISQVDDGSLGTGSGKRAGTRQATMDEQR